MNKHLKNLNRIEFVVTNACTGKCKHCSQGEHNNHDKINKSLASDAVRKIAIEYNIKSVMTFGGEPLLCPETVCEIHKAAREMKERVAKLVSCSVNNLWISTFHSFCARFLRKEIKVLGKHN